MKNYLLILVALFVFVSCEKGDPDPVSMLFNNSRPDIKYNHTHTFSWTRNEGLTPTWKSSNEKVGTIDAEGTFTARKIGETTITLSAGGKSDETKVIVTPYITFLTEPIVEFGSTIANVKSKEKRKLFEETDDLLVYEGENSKIRFVSYYKQNEKITAVLVLFEQNATNIVADVTTFFKERYPDNSLINNDAVFLSDDRKFGITLSVHPSLGLNAIYAQDDSGGRVTESSQLAHFKKDLTDMLSK